MYDRRVSGFKGLHSGFGFGIGYWREVLALGGDGSGQYRTFGAVSFS